MNKLNSIIVGVDFSECSQAALRQAVRMAHWNESRLHVPHCVEYLTLSDSAWVSDVPHEQLEQDAEEEVKQRLHRWLREAGTAGRRCDGPRGDRLACGR